MYNLVMKNDKKIITESYHNPMLGWTPEKCMKALEGTLIKFFKGKDIINEFNGQFVPKDFFDWKPVLNSKPEISTLTSGKSGMKIMVKYTYDLSKEEISNFIFGNEKNKKVGGIIWNENFQKPLEAAGFLTNQDPVHNNHDVENDEEEFYDESVLFSNIYRSLINEDNDDASDGDYRDDEEDGNGSDPGFPQKLKLSVIFGFSKFDLSDKVKNKSKIKNKFNANYITKMSGSISLKFGESSDSFINVGTINFKQKRTKNMDPADPPSLGKEIKKAFTAKPPPGKLAANDFGLIGVLAKHSFKRMVGSVVNMMTVIQEEDFDVDIDEKFNYENNLIGGAETDEHKSLKDSSPTNDKLSNEINKDLKLCCNDNYIPKFEMNDAKHFKIYIKSKKGGNNIFAILGELL